MEAYGVAGYEMPQTLLLNYSYELPFGRGRQFMSNGDSFGYKVLNQAIGGWNIAGVTTWNPKGTPVLVPDVPGGQTVPGAALRESLAPGVKVLKTTDYSSALMDASGNFINSRSQRVFNSECIRENTGLWLGQLSVCLSQYTESWKFLYRFDIAEEIPVFRRRIAIL